MASLPSESQQSWGDGSSNPTAQNQQRSIGSLPNSALSQLTEGERQALIAVRGKVALTRRVGVLGGATLTWYLIHIRAKKRFGMMAKIGATIAGAVIGGAVLMPVGLYWGQADIRTKVEDQDHFKRVLSGAMANARNAATPPKPGSHPSQRPAENGNAYPSLDTSSRSGGQRQDPRTSNSNQWGDESFDDSILYSSQSSSSAPSNATFDQMSAGPSATPPSSSLPRARTDDRSSSQTPPQNAEDPSRWTQIRNERSGAQASSWERIRQENAKQAYQQQQQRQQSSGRAGPSSDSPAGGADPSFGKGITAQRAQAQRDYEASFERERRGLDG